MKKIYFYIILLTLPVSAVFCQIERTFYIDFGPNDVTNGNITSSPDTNGNYWNNPTDPLSSADAVNLIDNTNQATDIYLNVTAGMATNGILNGGLLDPDSALLDDFAIPTATQDYFFTTSSGSILFSGLNPLRGYRFSMFASRNTTEVRKTKYTISGATVFIDTLETSGPDIGGVGYNGNNSSVLVSDTIQPDKDGNIQLSVSLAAVSFAYLNVLKIEEINLDNLYYIDFGPNDTTNGNITANPDTNGFYWNNPTDGTVSGTKLYLVNKDNKESNIYLQVTSAFATNGILNGGLLTPEDSLLGAFAIPTATEDYFFTTTRGQLEFGGLSQDNKYVFSFFASRNTSQTRWSRYTLTGSTVYVDSLQSSGLDLGGTGYNGNNSTILKTDTLTPDENGIIYVKTEVAIGGFAYINCMMIVEIKETNYSDTICPEKDSLLIAMMGSSVALGYGATDNQGYAYMYNQELQERYLNDEGADWSITNISVGGNTTVDLLDRWDSDLLPLCSRYVIYGVSLGNEEIHEFGQPRFDQFRDNMLILIDKARENGIEPVIVNCYTRSDFTETDYGYIKDMNLLIHSWDVASINVLGAVDDGSGRWAAGYYHDGWHPNTAGHQEFFYSMAPSLFDALDAGKPQPVKDGNTSLQIEKPTDGYQLEFIPDGIVHPFTISFEVKTSSSGTIAAIHTGNGYCKLSIDESGYLVYSSAGSDGISGNTILNDDQWHRVSLTHYYARGVSYLYVDDIEQGSVSEKIVSNKFILSGIDAPTAAYREWFFFRSAMNEEEISAIVNNEMLKSSLELYAPLDGEATSDEEKFVNKAQSTNQIIKTDEYELVGLHQEKINGFNYQCTPNPAVGKLHISFAMAETGIVNLSIYDITGRVVKTFVNAQLPPGNYEYYWNGESDNGFQTESGYYLSNLKINMDSNVKGFVFIR